MVVKIQIIVLEVEIVEIAREVREEIKRSPIFIIKENLYMIEEQIELLQREFLILIVDCIIRKILNKEDKRRWRGEKDQGKDIQKEKIRGMLVIIVINLGKGKDIQDLLLIADFTRPLKHKKKEENKQSNAENH